MSPSTNEINQFIETLWSYYNARGRHDLPWRQPGADSTFDPYRILVSELMLQQTQVVRVIPKFNEFITVFPNVPSLAQAELATVLRLWSGLGYNRRAKFLWQAAKYITNDNGRFPDDLTHLPGVGTNTAGAIQAYAFNQPAVFIETNVRTVYIHHFFNGQYDMADAAIREMLVKTLDTEQPREFYWALMDYGSYLKQTVGNANKQSKTYVKQSTFHGSRRQLRGQVLRALADRSLRTTELALHIPDSRLGDVLDQLVAEQLIKRDQDSYFL